MNVKVKLQIPGVKELIQRKGFAADGVVQMFHTQNVLRRIKKYMPFRTGATYKLTVIQTDIRKPEIVTDTPYAKYLFYGKVMVDPKTGAAGFLTPEGWRSRRGCVKVLTNRDLEFDRTKNPQAGPRWDKALSAAEGAAMAADLQRYIDRRAGK
ncbi:MAG: hypothetical protein IJW45_00725 [Oscillospiraceae bacterium]|nr:hypothetical protein [Oscillospiraceae bacterium]